ncbi:MAG TPA: hypothetical protein VMW08_08085 [Acidimicrobiales bacterium]|nr:hypothetical protein [Acidimicrobiales bacterium]
MFETDDRLPDFDPAGPPTDDEIEAAVARLVAAFGGGELMTEPTHDRRPLTAA